MTPTLMLMLGLITAAGDDLSLQCEKTRVTVCMWMLAPKETADSDNDQKGDATHRNCTCRGTMKIKSGDGLIDIPCPCGKYCAGECKKTAMLLETIKTKPPRLPVRQMLVIGAKYCTYCVPIKANAILLQKAGWDAWENDLKAMISIVDFDTQFDAVKTYGIEHLPTVLILNNGVVERKLVGDEITKDVYEFSNLLIGEGYQEREYLTPRDRIMTHIRVKRPAAQQPVMVSTILPPNGSPPGSEPVRPRAQMAQDSAGPATVPLTWHYSGSNIRSTPARVHTYHRSVFPFTIHP